VHVCVHLSRSLSLSLSRSLSRSLARSLAAHRLEPRLCPLLFWPRALLTHLCPTPSFLSPQRFNSDPTIDVLLLTTAVGGLGLNLTSADIVIFLEHDWNPAKDLQVSIHGRVHRLAYVHSAYGRCAWLGKGGRGDMG
jgi:hypothetical protein